MFEELSPPYATIVADPPWAYEEGFVAGPGHGLWPIHDDPLPYSSMTVAEIAAMPVNDLAPKDCRLFLWTTNRYLPDAFEIIRSWGFRYRQILTWHKTDSNLGGSIAPTSSEFLLVAIKGKPTKIGHWHTSVIQHSHGAHSVKPAVFLDLVEHVSPAPYLELFARAPRLGWDSWGYGFEDGPAAPVEGTEEK